MRKCLHCQKVTNNPKFCNRSCAASFNNSKSPKRKKEGICVGCGADCNSSRSRCVECFDKSSMVNATLGHFDTYRAAANKYGVIRFHARKAMSEIEDVCVNCGYDKHVEVCHIIAIKDHSKDDTVSFINRMDNLVKLCPNCHWEFDNGLLNLG